jgi:hypothetical protein
MKSSMKVLSLILVLFCMNNSAALAATPGNGYLSIYPEHVQVVDPDKRALHTLNHYPTLIVDHVSSVGYEVYGPKGLQQYLTSRGLTASIATEDKITVADYPSNEKIVAKMVALQKAYPNLITLTEIGKSVEGRSLVFARISAPNDAGKPVADRPEFKYIANMHGDEIVGRDSMLLLIEDLASHYGNDARITQILNTTQVYILPSMNPDGAFHKVRFNAHGVDLNRTFPDFATSDNQNTWDHREPEIQAVANFQAKHHFKLSANFHGGSQVVNYPWDTIKDLHPMDSLFKSLSLDYARRVPYLWNSSEFKNGVTNGYAWYEVDGGMQDWSCYYYKDLQVTIELTYTKYPAYSTVGKTYQDNRDALLAYIENIQKI